MRKNIALRKSCWLHQRESEPDVEQGPSGVHTSPTWLDPAQVWQNFKKLMKILRYLIPPRMLHPLPPQVAKIV